MQRAARTISKASPPTPAPAAARRIVVIGTGGTIAGTAASAGDAVGYQAGQLGIDTLLAGLPLPPGFVFEAEQLAQLDSKDMTHAVWQRLAQHCAQLLAQADVAGIVVTHGTDTLEETAYLLARVLAPAKPLLLTAAMRPATAQSADGPRNLADSLAIAALPDARGVLVAAGGALLRGDEVRKSHPWRLDALTAADAGVLGWIENGRLRRLRDWPAAGGGLGSGCIEADVAAWPRVDIVTSHAGADGRIVDALVAHGSDGIVVACTGNGTLHEQLEAALRRAHAAGVLLLRASRCGDGALVEAQESVSEEGDDTLAVPTLPGAGGLTPAQARVELLLRLLSQRAA